MSGASGRSAAAPAWQAATKVDLPLVDQAPQPKRQGFLVAGKGTLLGGDPGDLMLSDHTTRDGLQKDFPDCHESDVTTSLHLAAPSLAPWLDHATDSLCFRCVVVLQPGVL